MALQAKLDGATADAKIKLAARRRKSHGMPWAARHAASGVSRIKQSLKARAKAARLGWLRHVLRLENAGNIEH